MKNLTSFFVVFFVLLSAEIFGQVQVSAESYVPTNWTKTISTVANNPVERNFGLYVANKNTTKLSKFVKSSLFKSIVKKFKEKNLTSGSLKNITDAFKELKNAKVGNNIYLNFGSKSIYTSTETSKNYIYIQVPLDKIYVNGFSSAQGYLTGYSEAQFNLSGSGTLILRKSDLQIVLFAPNDCGNLTSVGYLVVGKKKVLVTTAKPDTVIGGDIHNTWNITYNDNRVDNCCPDKPSRSNFKWELGGRAHIGGSCSTEWDETTTFTLKVGVKVNDVFAQLAMTSAAEGMPRIGFSQNGKTVANGLWADNGQLSVDLTNYGENNPFWIAIEKSDGSVEFVEFKLNEFIKDGTEVQKNWTETSVEELNLESTFWMEFGPRLKMTWDRSYYPDYWLIVGIGGYGGLNTSTGNFDFGGVYTELALEYHQFSVGYRYLFDLHGPNMKFGSGLEVTHKISKTMSLGLGFTYLEFDNFIKREIGITFTF